MSPTLQVGWREWAALPDLGLTWIKVKVDTGARTSALHAGDIDYFEKNGAERVRFYFRSVAGSDEIGYCCEAVVIEYREVTDSGGNTERRPVIRSTTVIGEHQFLIDITLTDRSAMRFPMLLGRTALPRDAMVLPRHSFLLGGSRHEPPETL